MPFKDETRRREAGREASRRYVAKKTSTKIAAIEAKLNARPQWPETDLAWAAGLFEGEGTITMSVSGKYSRSLISLTNTDREIVDFFQRRWPGVVHPRKRERAHHRQAWVWRLHGQRTIGFLEDVGPFFRTSAERAKAALLIKSQRARWAGYRLEGHLERIDVFVREMKALNRKGPNDQTVAEIINPIIAFAYKTGKMPLQLEQKAGPDAKP